MHSQLANDNNKWMEERQNRKIVRVKKKKKEQVTHNTNVCELLFMTKIVIFIKNNGHNHSNRRHMPENITHTQ